MLAVVVSSNAMTASLLYSTELQLLSHSCTIRTHCVHTRHHRATRRVTGHRQCSRCRRQLTGLETGQLDNWTTLSCLEEHKIQLGKCFGRHFE
jgi:hypothetical protein